MRIKILDENIRPDFYHPVRLKEMGSFYEIRFAKKKTETKVKKLSANEYMVIDTGEVKEYRNRTITRAENIASVKQSMSRLRDLIRTNVTNPRNCRWVTLTYGRNQCDPKQLYQDFRRYNQRFMRYLKNERGTSAEWIAVAEPQGRGAWHMHVLYIFPKRAPFIPNNDFAKIWRHGWTKFQALKQSSDVALYLTAYLCDMPLEEAIQNGLSVDPHSLTSKKVGKKTKAIIKGARLNMYPRGMKLYRTSRGIRRPETYITTEEEAQETIAANNAHLIYEKTIAVVEEYENIVVNEYNYRQYRVSDGDTPIENRIARH